MKRILFLSALATLGVVGSLLGIWGAYHIPGGFALCTAFMVASICLAGGSFHLLEVELKRKSLSE